MRKTNKLPPQRERFCQEYLRDLNGKQAAVRAGYSERTAQEQASQLLSNLKVQARVQELMDKRAKKVEIEAEDVLGELKRLGHSDVKLIFNENGTIKPVQEWPEDLSRAVQSIEVEEIFEGSGPDRTWIGYTKKVKFWDKPKSLELMGKHKKLFTEKIEHSGKVTLAELVAGADEDDGSKDS